MIMNRRKLSTLKATTQTKNRQVLSPRPGGKRKQSGWNELIIVVGALACCVFLTFHMHGGTSLNELSFRPGMKPRMVQISHPEESLYEDVKFRKSKRNAKSWLSKSKRKKFEFLGGVGEVARLKPAGDDQPRDTCAPSAKWQSGYSPTCNAMHEFDLTLPEAPLVNNGAFRDVWLILDGSGTKRAIKTLRWEREFDHRNFDRHRRDAVAFDQLTASKHVVSIHGSCSNSAVFDFCLGDLFGVVNRTSDEHEMLQVAYDVSLGMVDTHHFNKKGQPTIAHTDIKPDQWILGTDGKYRLADFNRARFLLWDTKKKEVCPFYVGKNAGRWRAPEEYQYGDQGIEADMWSLGNVLFFLLARIGPWDGMGSKDVAKLVKKGKRPPIPEMKKSRFTKAMNRAINLCYVTDPKERGTAKEVAKVLKDALDDW